LPQKHKEATRVRYDSGIFITTNVYPDFGHDHDNQAIRRRLDVFNTSALQRKDGSVSGELKKKIISYQVFKTSSKQFLLLLYQLH